MIFRTKKFEAAWDTWVYYHDDTFYMYYLIAGKQDFLFDGFGVATSKDGVHFKDYGKKIKASDKMTHYLGTGSVWEDPNDNKRFLCNYSEYRIDDNGKKQQNILFAWSNDLINWNKFGDDYMFKVDERYYERYGRWDCINTYPRKEGGYWGSWTATPKGLEGGRIGFGYSEDGIKWTALPPNKVIPHAYESGSFIEYNGRFHAMFGADAMYAYTADDIISDYNRSTKNSMLLASRHTYFSRYFNYKDKILVNHHSMIEEKSSGSFELITYFAPIKEFTVDAEGIQRWKYWEGNDILKGKSIQSYEDMNLQTGMVFEYDLNANNLPNLFEFLIDESKYKIKINSDGSVNFNAETAPEKWQMNHEANREIDFGDLLSIRVLTRAGILELYINDYFMESWTMGCSKAENIKLISDINNIKCWQMDI